MREKCEEAGLDHVLLYVGGNIVVGKQDFTEVEKRFKDMGFNRVYPPGIKIDDVLDTIKLDLGGI
jgi:methylaspartate mutase sigma subunit